MKNFAMILINILFVGLSLKAENSEHLKILHKDWDLVSMTGWSPDSEIYVVSINGKTVKDNIQNLLNKAELKKTNFAIRSSVSVPKFYRRVLTYIRHEDGVSCCVTIEGSFIIVNDDLCLEPKELDKAVNFDLEIDQIIKAK